MPTLFDDHLREHRETLASFDSLLPQIETLAQEVWRRLATGGIVYSFGNGGSAADAMHLAGELAGHYRLDRRPFGAVALGTDPALSSCISNDYSFDEVFARPLRGAIRPGDIAWGFTTSGRSANVCKALEVAREAGALTVVCTGAGGAGLACDHILAVDSAITPRIQEAHELIVHMVADFIDRKAGE